jgi:hypothetical protein
MKGNEMTNANITRVLAGIALFDNTSEYVLRVTHSDSNGFQVALRAQMMVGLHAGKSMPLFDDNGDFCLSAYGASLDEAMAKLDAICATCHPEQF